MQLPLKRKRTVALSAFVLALGGFAALAASLNTPNVKADGTPAPSDPPECVVATWGNGAVLRISDVDALRARVSPAPTGDAAKRWALDAHLAAWEAGVDRADPEAVHRAYTQWLANTGVAAGHAPDAAALRSAVRTLHDRASITKGACFSLDT